MFLCLAYGPVIPGQEILFFSWKTNANMPLCVCVCWCVWLLEPEPEPEPETVEKICFQSGKIGLN